MEAEKYQIDLGNLMAYDPSHHFPSLPDSMYYLLKFQFFLVFLGFLGFNPLMIDAAREELTKVFGECAEARGSFDARSSLCLRPRPVMSPLLAFLSLPQNSRGEKHALAVVEYLIANGSDRAVDDILECSSKIAAVSSFEYVEPNGKDLGINVRKKAETILGLGRHFSEIRWLEIRKMPTFCWNRDSAGKILKTIGDLIYVDVRGGMYVDDIRALVRVRRGRTMPCIIWTSIGSRKYRIVVGMERGQDPLPWCNDGGDGKITVDLEEGDRRPKPATHMKRKAPMIETGRSQGKDGHKDSNQTTRRSGGDDRN
ncbi:hypothetical protein J5N97_013393 [Dioscorea zingiberensis]|uniref:ENTH domain-containing protein n=1 Tax=Dioscorea zingiberensis TaxID=325984 RepID=A0A9D5CRR8_9LILI|nr:hypothetical protein J5N97_013393 [Dioscorea zingiberensis]